MLIFRENIIAKRLFVLQKEQTLKGVTFKC